MLNRYASIPRKFTMQCPKCGGDRVIKNGKTDRGQRHRYKCKACGHRTTNPHRPVGTELPGPGAIAPLTVFPSDIPTSKRYVITAAQNATPVFKPFLKSLIHYCKKVKAELIVIPFRYRNPTSQWTEGNESHEWWAKEIVPYLYDGRFDLNDHLTILADIKVQPTATSPLTGLESITGPRSGIVGHTKLQLKTVATPNHKLPKIMATTGAVTKDNYSDTKTGKKGEFHHSFGASVVELDGDVFHLRQINATKSGSFIDLDTEVTPTGCKEAPPASLVMGDTHVDFVDPGVVAATFTNKDSIIRTLKINRLVWHDLLDFYSRNHHHRGDPILAVAKHKAGVGDVRAEVDRACAFVDTHTPKACESIIVTSNHPEALNRWIKETDWRGDPENAAFYLETALAMVRSAKMTDQGSTAVDPFVYWAEKWIKNPKVKFPKRTDSYTVKNIEVGMHGDRGPNGARGNIKGFSRIGVRSIVGHSHSPAIEEGCYQVGTSTRLQLEYNTGPSSWLNTHCVVYANGKRSLISIINGKWRL